ncbi:unnamed protein product [Acanthocheilonema viteae]|uniref:Chitin-binding type-2 domain-containing protein n=1 Tax=Acanthocheilonema viteae TaxID=6277 RepID=A0A498SU75_ACAVI|nr:unnamed protein product [Acanthocheilonema viteae]
MVRNGSLLRKSVMDRDRFHLAHVAMHIFDAPTIQPIFNGVICEVARNNCISIWSKRMGKINFETEKLFEEMNFCYDDGPGIYMFPKIICSRQAYVCKNHNEGFAITCLPGIENGEWYRLVSATDSLYIVEYSVCKNGHWEDQSCPTGMMYFEADQTCRTDPSCAHPFECKIGQSFQLKCNEYLICSSKGVVEHHFCPPFHRWNSRTRLCISDDKCLSSSSKLCKEGTVIDSFDCKFYYQCSGGKWHKMSCMTYPAVELCKSCRYSDNNFRHTEERCNKGDAIANPHNCQSYAICDDGRWRNDQCEVGTFWNQQLKRCHHTTDCIAFKRAKCIHGQHLVGGICNEYLKCLQGSWITMKCLPGYAFNVTTKKCAISNECVSSNNNYLSIIDYGIADSLASFFQAETKQEQSQQLHWVIKTFKCS